MINGSKFSTTHFEVNITITTNSDKQVITFKRMKLSSDNGAKHWLDTPGPPSITMSYLISGIKKHAFAICFAITTFSTPWWWGANAQSELKMSATDLAVPAAMILLVFFLTPYLYLRSRSKRNTALASHLHDIVYQLRCAAGESQQASQDSRGYRQRKTFAASKTKLIQDANAFCVKATEYFRVLTGDNTVGCAIRILMTDDDVEQYVTVGRAGVLTPDRESKSAGIKLNQGVPAFFLSDQNSATGILYYYDLQVAASVGIYLMTENDQEYPSQVKTFMVAPVNAWDGNKNSLVALLFITSSKKNVFKEMHSHPLRAISECLALMYTVIFNNIKPYS